MSSSSSSRGAPAASSSLMPQHSADLASELSAHLNEALADDKSYAQMNDAKLRGMSAMVGWDQFHGMVLTAHLKPVNLRAEPIDELARGVPRQRKLEQARQRNVDGAAMAPEGRNVVDEKQDVANLFLKQLDMQLPTNVHEWSRDWKRLASNGATGDELQQLRYRYLLTLPLRSPSSALLKGGLPLDIIADSIGAIYWRWTQQQQQPDSQSANEAAQATNGDAVTATPASAAVVDASALATGDVGVDSSDDSTATAAVDPLPPPSDVWQLLTLLHGISSMSSFSIALFSLTPTDKARLAEVLDLAQRAVQSERFRRWQHHMLAPPNAAASAAAPTEATAVPAASADSASAAEAASPSAAAAAVSTTAATAAAPSRSDFAHAPARDNARAIMSDNVAAAAAASSAARPAASPSPSSGAAAATPPAGTVDAQLINHLRTKFKLPKQ